MSDMVRNGTHFPVPVGIIVVRCLAVVIRSGFMTKMMMMMTIMAHLEPE